MSEVIILDVGHGNAAVVKHDGRSIVIDAPSGSAIVEALNSEQVDDVDLAIASHSDADHLAGLISLLLHEGIHVKEVRCNPDANRDSKFWDDFKVAVRAAREDHGTRLRTELTTETTPDLAYGELAIEVLSPPADLAVGGVGSNYDGRRVGPNSMSAVLRVVWGGEAVVLLAGDIDSAGLLRMIEDGQDLRARVLVFPHHGGWAGGAGDDAHNREFARQFAETVNPETVVFSMARRRFKNPQPAIVAGVRDAVPDAHIACTQLSPRCSAELLASHDHLTARYALGRADRLCCAGTLVIDVEGTQPARAAHQAAIQLLPQRLCAADF